MSDEELRDQINKIAVEIESIEETAKKKEAYVRNKLNQEFDPKIQEVESKLERERAILDEILKRGRELVNTAVKLVNGYMNYLKRAGKQSPDG